MILSINQPAYNPWLGYFERIARSDVHVVLDHVQFEKNSFTNRNKIRAKNSSIMLTIPLATKGQFGDLAVNRLKFAEPTKWRAKHWASIKMNYSRCPCFDELKGPYEDIYSKEWTGYMPFVKALLFQHLADLGIGTQIVFSSQMQATGSKSNLILNLCNAIGSKSYLSGALGRDYLNADLFAEAGISIEYQDYDHPVYSQAWPGFYSHLGIFDLLFNHGETSLDILLNS